MSYEHLFRMTDSTGIFQHSKYSIPDLFNGYTTDDNSRALIIACWLYKKTKNKKFLDLVYCYSSFLYYAQNNEGKWKNFMNYQRKFLDEVGSEDCFGRSFWSVGFMNSCKDFLPNGLNTLNVHMIKSSIFNIRTLKHIRSQAYSLVGLTYIKDIFIDEIEELINILSDNIINAFERNQSHDWYWFEDTITYGNGIIPYALLRAYEITNDEKHLQTANKILDFLNNIIIKNNHLKLIGCNGWYNRNGDFAEFDEQPIDALDMILSYSKAYRINKKDKYLHKAHICYSWFEGNNILKQSLIDKENDGCYDGITAYGVNKNQGAESQFAYIMSKLVIESL